LAIVVNDLELRRMHSLYSTLLADATFHELLLVFDQDIVSVILLFDVLWFPLFDGSTGEF
jgi:hypothetical protein